MRAALIAHLKDELVTSPPDGSKTGAKKFFNYLVNHYLKPSATNNFSRWDYSGQIVEYNTIEISTNSAESINALIGDD